MDDKGMPSDAPRQDQLLEEGSFWFARMRGPDAELYRPEFNAWLARGAAHRGAYNRAGEIFALGKFLAGTPDLASSNDRMPGHLDPSKWKGFVLVGLAMLTIGTGAWINRAALARLFAPAPQTADLQSSSLPSGVELATRSGERRSFLLADGSKVMLDPDSRLLASFGTERRELRLQRGRARFDVAHEKRPFIVFAGGGSVTARGTIFDVIVSASKNVTVRLLRGAVDVVRPVRSGDTQSDVAHLKPGEMVSFADTNMPDPGALAIRSSVLAADMAPVRADAREFNMAPLSSVVAEANKGSSRPIRFNDPAIGALKVSGRFRIDDPARVADHLATLFDLTIDKSRGDEILLEAQ